MSCGKLELSLSTGTVTVSNVTCVDKISTVSSTGKTNLTNVNVPSTSADGRCEVTMSTGDIIIEIAKQ